MSLTIDQYDATCPRCLRPHQDLLNDADGPMCATCHNLSSAGLREQTNRLQARLGTAAYERRRRAAEGALL